ncbi:MAG: agmatinase [Peptococcaceae bacterium]|jgi:agmatinase|nr:agmatinase [Peptococcaceae bacterium]
MEFMGARSSYGEAGVVLLGAPMDWTTSFRAGARHAPPAVRLVSQGLEEYSPYLDRDLGQCLFHDAGDLALPPGDVPASLRNIADAAGRIIGDGKFPLLLGGEHLVTLPAVERAASRYPGLTVVHLDAHADLADDYMGLPLSHATVMRRVSELVGDGNVFQFGVRSCTRPEVEYARRHTRLAGPGLGALIPSLEENLPHLKDRPVYVTLDIDVVDPAFAPGTGTAEPGGCTSRDVLTAVHLLGSLHLVGFDLVEVCPPYDQSQRTALLAAEIVREVVLSRR